MSDGLADDPGMLIAQARGGDEAALGRLLELYRNYLALIARSQIGQHLQGRASASDVVQEAYLDACRGFARFNGTTERELMAWLRQVLVGNIARLVRDQVLAQKRSTTREVPLPDRLDESAVRLDAALAANASSPSAQASRRERAAVLADVLAQLPDDYRDVIALRNLEGLPFEDVAQRMGRTSGAVRVLWVRAVDALRRRLVRGRPAVIARQVGASPRHRGRERSGTAPRIVAKAGLS
ncbi:MAG: sigma-70 family RNA polymerase sigma factor [Gemmataceae bacterium]|nr:sigma-70 family RNA polymerase sigma factor [Gemmataceae bacterium]